MGQKRTKTNYKSIYFNEDTGKYDIKYNFKEYNPIAEKNIYKSKWVYNLKTVSEAKTELAKLQMGEFKASDKEITLEGIYNIWKEEAKANGYSVITERNTEQQIRMIYQFLPSGTKLKNITGDNYTYLISKCREKGYSEETLHSINSCFRKLMKLAWKKEYISENPLDKVQNKKFKVKIALDENSPKYITKSEFKLIDDYFKNNSFVRLGVDRYKGFMLMINFLYYTGLRVGELLALEFADVEPVQYHKGRKQSTNEMVELVLAKEIDTDSFDGFQVNVNKVFLDSGALSKYPKRIRKETKNHKNRVIPLSSKATELFVDYQVDYYMRGGKPTDRIFNCENGNCRYMIKKACEKMEIRHHKPHDFRHTFISNLLDSGMSLAQVEMFSGDTQETILKRYSHANENSKKELVVALDKL